MRALRFLDKLKLIKDYPKPKSEKDEALIKVLMAGICNTDIEITRGYSRFHGTLGHEFVGIVEEVNSTNKSLVGKRVVGEINIGCGDCEFCRQDLARHCKNIHVLGIVDKDGYMAEYVTLPIENLIVVPDSISDECATFCEPLAAGMEILEQVHIKPMDKICILGDGKLGLLIDFALSGVQADITHVGKHKNKLDIIKNYCSRTMLIDELTNQAFDIVVEATGSVNSLETSLKIVKPHGTIILKSTVAASKEIDLTPVVVNEITIVGSRCGRFQPALNALATGLDLTLLISKVYPFEESLSAFDKACEKGTLKILLDMR
ncbi:MAG: alcohol dehydrogenase catalytic domain-containing protein [Candidatus Tenebribacter burtonii]|nr:alcohol dehydrogenase catalytic domain-containing protein [Candidatus Tenebribacter burtonii]